MADPLEIVRYAESKLGCPYVYGTWGQTCTPSLRKRYAGYNPSQASITFQRCQVLRPSNPKSSCDGCPYQGMLAFDCRGFTHWCLEQVGISITGGYVGRQWTDKNWDSKGTIDQMPDLICCVFVKKGDNWKHTGLHVGGGNIIHCSKEVKRDKVGGENNWTHYAIPKGLYTADEIKNAKVVTPVSIMKKGSRGEAVRALQEMLNKLGFSCGKADGIFGANTEAAVKRFQTAEGLDADGIAGEQTLTRLAMRSATPSELPVEAPQSVSEPDPDKSPTEEISPVIDDFKPVTMTLDYETALQLFLALKDIFERGETVG